VSIKRTYEQNAVGCRFSMATYDAERYPARAPFGFHQRTLTKVFGFTLTGGELLVLELIHVLTRRERFSFIPAQQKNIFAR
jgi:hypothetical protein